MTQDERAIRDLVATGRGMGDRPRRQHAGGGIDQVAWTLRAAAAAAAASALARCLSMSFTPRIEIS